MIIAVGVKKILHETSEQKSKKKKKKTNDNKKESTKQVKHVNQSMRAAHNECVHKVTSAKMKKYRNVLM